MHKHFKSSLFIALSVAFLDNMGVGIIYPLFTSMLFDTSCPLLAMETTSEMRGFLLGILLSLFSLAQFFSSPFWGTISDNKGRKKPLQLTLFVTVLGYLIALGSIFWSHILLLLFSRILIGFASGNISIVQATIADLSTTENKAKNFGLYNMAMGAGFTLGPFFGGFLSSWGYAVPFLFAFVITICNLILSLLFFKETNLSLSNKRWDWREGFSQLKKAFRWEGLRILFLTCFLFNFAWSFFIEFLPVYLIAYFQFSSMGLGLFFGLAGAFYAISSGWFIRPLLGRFQPRTLYFWGTFLAALFIFMIPIFPSIFLLWPLLFIVTYFLSIVWSTSTTIVSNSVSAEIQGETLGILGSIVALSQFLSPLFSGTIVGKHPSLPLWLGGTTMLLSALILAITFRKKLFSWAR